MDMHNLTLPCDVVDCKGNKVTIVCRHVSRDWIPFYIGVVESWCGEVTLRCYNDIGKELDCRLEPWDDDNNEYLVDPKTKEKQKAFDDLSKSDKDILLGIWLGTQSRKIEGINAMREAVGVSLTHAKFFYEVAIPAYNASR